MIVEALVLGGTLYAGTRAYRQVKANGRLVLPKLTLPTQWLTRQPTIVAKPAAAATASPAEQQANQSLVISSASLGLAAASVWLANPALSLASVPLMLYVFAPTFQAAWRTLRLERRVNNDVLDATRIVVCVVMRYDLVAAVNACLQAFTQRSFARAAADFERELHTLFGAAEREAWVFTKETELPQALGSLTAGDVVVVGTGESLPADGVVLYGTAWLDARLATGDSAPLWTWTGERVAAASIVQSGLLYVQLDEPVSVPVVQRVKEALATTTERKSYFQEIGERGAKRMAPNSLLAFAIALPLMGPNRAAGLLTTGFGNSLHTLGPYTTRNFLIPAAQQGMLIRDAHAFEAAILVNTILVDYTVLLDPVAGASANTTIEHLRRRPWLLQGITPHRFAVYVLVNKEQEQAARALVATLGLDDYLVASTLDDQVALLQRLRTGGRQVCYIAAGDVDPALAEYARVTIAWRGLNRLATTSAQVVLIERDLHTLVTFFELAAAFTAKQGFNLLTPIAFDLLDITTTIFIHFGLIYSVLFNYTGLLLSVANGRLPTPPVPKQPVAEAATTTLRLPAAT